VTIRIINADCREALRSLPDESVHCVVTSPPYWGLRDYGVAGQLGLESEYRQYVDNMVAVFSDVRRVLRRDGTLWLNLGDCYATGAGRVGEAPGGGDQGERFKGYRGTHTTDNSGKQAYRMGSGGFTQANRMPQSGLKPKDLTGIPWRVAFALQADGWWLRSDIIWAKPNPMPESVLDRPTRAHEYIFLLSNGERYFYDADAVRESYAETSIGRYETSMQSTAPTGRQPGGDIERKRREERIRDPNPLGRNRRTVWGSVNPILCRGALRDIPARADRAVHPGRVSRWRHSTGSIRRRWHHRLGRGSARPQRNPDRAKPRVRGDGPPPDRARLPALCKRDWRALYGH
jgi:hypothetical protein